MSDQPRKAGRRSYFRRVGRDAGAYPGVILVEKPFSEAALLDRVREVLDAGSPRVQ
jgi:hypothetical protein